MIAYSSLRLYLPLIRLSTFPLFLCWIKQLITLHCGTRRQWRPLLLYRAIHKAKRPALLREETDEWGIRSTYTTSTRSSNPHSIIHTLGYFLYRDRLFRVISISFRSNYYRAQWILNELGRMVAKWSYRGVEDRRESIYNERQWKFFLLILMN